MIEGSKKKNRYAAMFTKATPYEVAAAAYGMPFFLVLVIIWQPDKWLTIFDPDLMLITIPVTIFVVCGLVWGAMRFRRRMKALQDILALEKQLPWFGAEPVTIAKLPTREELDRLLSASDYETIHLDGASITSWRDLATVMQEQIGPMAFPADDRQKVRALLTYLAGEQPQRKVLIWHDATIAANHNPALIPSFASTWSAYAVTLPPGFLVFIDLPQHAEPHQATPDQTLHRGDIGPDPDRSNLKDAPNGAWWKPKPGELTR